MNSNSWLFDICSITCTLEDRSTWILDLVLTASNAASMMTSSKELILQLS